MYIFVVIQGHDRKGVLSAKTRIDVLVESARQKQPFTHFLSFPFVDDGITERLEEFKSDVQLNCGGVCYDIFFHLAKN